MCNPGFADYVFVDFEDYNIGSVNDQDGWRAGSSISQSVVNPMIFPSAFGDRSLSLSNAVFNTDFGNQMFAKPLSDSVGETAATAGVPPNDFPVGTKRRFFEVQFDIAVSNPLGSADPGLRFTLSPDRGDGSRMSFLSFEDTPGGILVGFSQFLINTGFDTVTIGIAPLDRTTFHNIKLTLYTPDGPTNDVVKVYIDGNLVKTGTSWEDYYPQDPSQAPERNPRIVKTVIFRTSTANQGTPPNPPVTFIVDNLIIGAI
jgi:hypothetical protein